MTDTTPRLVWSREQLFPSEAFEDITPRAARWLIKGALPLRGTGFMVGASKAGKTFVGLDWSVKIAMGATTVMQRRARQTGVVYVAAEDPDGCRLRIEAFKRKNPRESYTPFRLIESRINLLDPDQVEAFITEMQEIDGTFADQGHRLGLVVFDTFSRCIPGAEENSSESMSQAIDALDTINKRLECLVLALAHHGKAGASGGIRGWSGLDAASDATITVERLDEASEERVVTLSKVKNGPDGGKMAFTLDGVHIGHDEDGDDIWSCVVKYDYADAIKPKSAKKVALSGNAELVLRAMTMLLDKEVRQAPPRGAEGVRAGTWAVRREDLKGEASELGLMFDGEKDSSYRQRFGRAVIELTKAGKLRVMGDAIWLI